MDGQIKVNVGVAFLAKALGERGGQACVTKAQLEHARARAPAFTLAQVGEDIHFGIANSPHPESAVTDEGPVEIGTLCAALLFTEKDSIIAPSRQITGAGKARLGVIHWRKPNGDTILTLTTEGGGIEELLKGRVENDILFVTVNSARAAALT